MEVTKNQLLIKSPFRGFICGASGSGKSAFILNLLAHRNKLCETSFETIIYCHPGDPDHISEKDNLFFQKLREVVPFIQIVTSIPDRDELISYINKKCLLILEDMISDIFSSEYCSRLFTSISSHSNVSILTTSQNYFEQGKFAKTILRNQTFYVIFNSRGDNQSVSLISKKMFPYSKNFLNHCFNWLDQRITEQYKKYLFIDCSNDSNLPPTFPQVKTNLFSECPFFSPLFFAPK